MDTARLEAALKKAKKYSDWADIYDMACLVDSIDGEEESVFNAYRTMIAKLLGFTVTPPAIPVDDEQAKNAIVTWCRLKGYL